MQSPTPPADAKPPARFRPPHCPWPTCEAHQPSFIRPFVYHRDGYHSRKCDPRPVQRFRCGHCRRSFSTQSFSTTYYLKRPTLQEPIAAALVAGSAHRPDRTIPRLRALHRDPPGLAARETHGAVLGQGFACDRAPARAGRRRSLRVVRRLAVRPGRGRHRRRVRVVVRLLHGPGAARSRRTGLRGAAAYRPEACRRQAPHTEGRVRPIPSPRDRPVARENPGKTGPHP